MFILQREVARLTPSILMKSVLVIDDDTELCELLAEYLGKEGFEISAVHDGDEGLAAFEEGDFLMVILDVMLPGRSGFDVLRSLRERSRVPVLMLTAKGEEVDRIVGLEMGADDYLPKPFNPRELVARIRAVLRRADCGSCGEEVQEDQVEVGDVVLDLGTRAVTRGSEDVELTAVEFRLLEVLLRAAGKVVKREELSSKVLGRNLTRFDRSIDVHVSNLRKKLGKKLGTVERIRTIRGMGYLYARPGDGA